MRAKHAYSAHCLRSGIFDDLDSFPALESRLSALASNKERGDAFEVFAEAYLATQKIALASDVWPFEAIPQAKRQQLSLDTGRDMGVDGIYETTDGELRAYQVKFRSRRPALTWDELSTFMGLTDQVGQRVLFTNCDTLPSLMQDRSGFVAIRGSDLDRLTAEDFGAIREWLHSGHVERQHKQPRQHQDEALASIAAGLENNNRATVVMACGTGKSLVALWAAERQVGKTLLVLVPSLALVRQLLHEWLRETSWERFSFMCVCSDPTVVKGADDLVVHQADLDFPVTTDCTVVHQYLEKPFTGTRIVFSTYQSAQVVAEGMPLDANGQHIPFDLGIFDEAHKTASRDGTRFSFALENSNLPIRQRLFFTATPRHYDVRKKDKEGDSALVYSMDRPEVYGPVVHTLSFAEAARRGIICDYKVVISVVTSAMVDDHLLQKGEVIVGGDAVKARQVALQIALQKAVEKYGVSRIFTFHGSVKAARSFTSEDSEGISQHLPDFNTLHVSGEMPTARREEQMKAFRQADKAVMSNARCLTEGVDVPAVDMVAFISPRKSKVDIVQATGRAMRRSPGKEFGYVMVPLFVEQAADESIEEALKRTGYDDVWDLLGAMREQDDVLVDIIRQMQEDKGKTGGYSDSRFSERVEVLGPSVSLETIRESITAECLESLGVSWDEWFGKLIGFAKQKGHCLVPSAYRADDGSRLGAWVANQRTEKPQLSDIRISRLESMPSWAWSALDALWEEGYQYLADFVERERHCQAPLRFATVDGYRLGQWMSVQRKCRDDMPDDRRQRLEAIPGWAWDMNAEAWEIGFRHLADYVTQHGHCRMLNDYRTGDGYRLGGWASKQRRAKNELVQDKKGRLESLPGWVWDVFAAQWEEGFRQLCGYVASEGNCRVPQNYRTSDGFRLGHWVGSQRRTRDRLLNEWQQRLESLTGWMWDVNTERWEVGFGYLLNFSNREGHCQVPRDYQTEDGFRLGVWVKERRRDKNKLSIEQIDRLAAIPGWTWNLFDDKWDIGFRHIMEYAKREGHCRVLVNYRTCDGYRLGQWAAAQRTARDDLPIERKEQLEGVSGWVWETFTNQWETSFKYLLDFSLREGHCLVPLDYRTSDGFRLGLWVRNQRAARGKNIPAERKDRLEKVPGWVWSGRQQI